MTSSTQFNGSAAIDRERLRWLPTIARGLFVLGFFVILFAVCVWFVLIHDLRLGPYWDIVFWGLFDQLTLGVGLILASYGISMISKRLLERFREMDELKAILSQK